jgi:hypothetical protein
VICISPRASVTPVFARLFGVEGRDRDRHVALQFVAALCRHHDIAHAFISGRIISLRSAGTVRNSLPGKCRIGSDQKSRRQRKIKHPHFSGHC